MLSGLLGLNVEMDAIRQKHDEMGQALREKSKKLMQTQELYDKLKRKSLVGEVQHAASDVVNSSLDAGWATGLSFSGQPAQRPLYEQQPASPRHSQLSMQRTEHLHSAFDSARGSRQSVDTGWAKPPIPRSEFPDSPWLTCTC